jgi:biopolymer transport protein ExbD
MSLKRPGTRGGGIRRLGRWGKRDAVVELTPLIDITFQLLIFFLLTATFQTNPSFKVKLPKAKNQDVTQEPKALVVVINSEGVYEVDRKVMDPRELEMRLCTAAQNDLISGVNIKADEKTDHQYVVSVMDIAKACGVERLGILHGR